MSLARHHALAALVALLTASAARADAPTAKPDPGPNKKDEPLAQEFSLARATAFLDTAALHWQQSKKCFSCHTTYAYLYARPAVSASAPAHTTIRRALEELVTRRWPDKGPRWDAEVVATAAALAFNDAATTGTLHPTTKTALDRLWTVQQADGGYRWLKCGWPPMEIDDHYGVTLAAVAVGVAPGAYRESAAARAGLAKLRKYLADNPPRNAHHRAMLLWASSYLGDLLSEAQKKEFVRELRALQRPDGGWASAGLGTWKRADRKKQEPNVSDGYGTGFVVYVLRRAGVPSDDAALRRGVAWLKANQRASGRWFTRSLNRDTHHYLTEVGSAFAVMALAACDDKVPATRAR